MLGERVEEEGRLDGRRRGKKKNKCSEVQWRGERSGTKDEQRANEK